MEYYDEKSKKKYTSLMKMDSQMLRELLSNCIRTLFEKGELRTKNILGEIGEHDVISVFNNNAELPNLELAQTSQPHYDAIDKKTRETYSIKSITGKTTGVFTSLEFESNGNPKEQYFDYLIICKYDLYNLEAMYCITWDVFLKYKKKHSTMGKYNISITKKLIENSKIIYSTKKTNNK